MSEPLLIRPILQALGRDAKKTLAAVSENFIVEVEVVELPAEECSGGSVARIVSSEIFHSTMAAEEGPVLATEDENWPDLATTTRKTSKPRFRACSTSRPKIDCFKKHEATRHAPKVS